jgi:hypothetical protein
LTCGTKSRLKGPRCIGAVRFRTEVQSIKQLINGHLSNEKSKPRNNFIFKILLKCGILMCCCCHASRPFLTNGTTFQILSHFYSNIILNFERLWGMETCVLVKILLFYFMSKITMSETFIEEIIAVNKEKSNKMQQCIKILLFPIYMKLNMFRATHRSSSGA